MSRIAAQLAIDDTNVHRSFTTETEQRILESLKKSNERFTENYPGDPMERQPVHTFYGGAHLFKADTVKKLGQLALHSLEAYGSNFVEFAKVLNLSHSGKLPSSKKQIDALKKKLNKEASLLDSKNVHAWIFNAVYDRVVEKLASEPIEDYRIDFEDGFGHRTNAEEDHEAMRTAGETVRAMEQDMLPPFVGIRIKPFSEESKNRALRTLDIYLTTLCEKSNNRLPKNFVITLPKVTDAEHVNALAQCLSEFERLHHLPWGSLKLEIMIESPQAIIGPDGGTLLPSLVRAGKDRCIAVHFGPYDYTTGLNISSRYQTLDHPACDFARRMMQAALAGTGTRLSDGANHEIPVGPHRKSGRPLTAKQNKENREAVHRVWRHYYSQIRHTLEQGFYQSWDLHPGHLPIRYAAVYMFFLEGLRSASERMKSSLEHANKASLSGQFFDDAASGQGLLNYFLRGIFCGAIHPDDIGRIGLTQEELDSRSFSGIISGRNK